MAQALRNSNRMHIILVEWNEKYPLQRASTDNWF